jgi:hypothetical protein
VQFEIPYMSNYEVEYRFTRTKTDWGIAFFFFHSSHQYMWSFAGSRHVWMGFSGLKYPEGKDFGVRTPLVDGQHTLLLKINADKFEAVVDGKSENLIESPLALEKEVIRDHPAEMTLPYLSVLDWWGDTTIESAILTQYW